MCSLTTKTIDNICRTCMGEEENDHSIASPMNACKGLISILYKPQKIITERSNNLTILDILKQSMPQLSVESDDPLPKNVCKDCLDQLVSIYEFQQKCLTVENKLKNIFKQNNDIPNIADEDIDDPLTNDRPEDTLTDWRNFIKIEEDEPLISTDTRDNNRCGSNITVECYYKTNESEPRSIEDDHDDICGTLPKQTRLRSARYSKATALKSLERTIGRRGHCNDDNTESKDFACQQCGRRLKTRKSLRRHEKIHLHDTSEGSDVTKLSQEFHQVNDSEEKSKNVDCSTKPNNSEMCNPKDITDSVEQTSITQKEPSEEKPLSCSECGSCFKTGKGLKRHLRSHLRTSMNNSEQNQNLDECQNSSDESGDGRESASLENKNEQTNCNQSIIGDETPKKADKDSPQDTIEPHPQQGNDIADKQYVCDECGRHLKTRKSLKRHKRIHQRLPGTKVERSKPNHTCEYCQKVFCQSSSLKDHLRVHTGEQPYLCSECGKAFTSLSNMKQHFLRHGTARPYECPDCPKRFPCHSDLASHKAVHNKAKTHVCDICGAGFVKPYLLKKHKMYHTGEKNHKCDYCDMRFVLADQCRRHMRTHTGEKPYKCKYCVRAFAQSNDLIKHLRGHLGDNVYKCDLCPQGFRLQGELRAHFNTHKNDDEQTKLKNFEALIEDELRLQLKFNVT